MSQQAPAYCAIVVSWNSLAHLPGCIDSLRRQSVPAVHIVVVDNGSSDGSLDWLRLQSDLTLISNAGNAGFAAANNQGLETCAGDFVLLLNADVVLQPDYAARCLQRLNVPEVGSVTGKLLRATPPGMIDSTGHVVYGLGWTENRGEELADQGYDEPGEVFGVCAAAGMYRCQALDSVRLDGQVFDETYVNYIEDVDLDWRLRWRGWGAWYEPRAIAVHHRSASGARFTSRVMRDILKNRILTVAKNYDGAMLLRNLPGIIIFTVTKTIDFGRQHPAAALGLWDALRLLPRALRQRRAIKALRRAEGGEMARWLQPFPWRRRMRRRLDRARRRPLAA